MAVTDPELIRFCNQQIRGAADRYASLYYECRHLLDLRIADADMATTILIREAHIRSVSDRVTDTFAEHRLLKNIWFNVGTPTPINGRIPNTTEAIEDGSPGDGRPPITGQDVHNVVANVIAVENWLNDAAFGGPGTGTQIDAMLNTIIVCGADGNDPLRTVETTTFIDNRCGELTTEYEANGSLVLAQMLAVAPNPRNPA